MYFDRSLLYGLGEEVKLLTREENENISSEFSRDLNLTYEWFNTHFTQTVCETFCEFWGESAEVKLISVSENTNLLAQREEFFVTQIRLNKELSVFIRLSKPLVKNLLENILGPNGKTFNIEKITDLEAKILTGFDDFLYKNLSQNIKQGADLPENNRNYNECNLTFFLRVNQVTLGKIVIKIPVVAIRPERLVLNEEVFSISDFKKQCAEVNLSVGHTRMRLNELKHLEIGDLVVLEYSKSSKMLLKYKDFTKEIKVAPNPYIMIEGDFDDNGQNPKGENMPGSDIYNMWDTIQVDINAEFEKVKLTLGELKQISEGLVIDIGSVYDNKIDLKVEDKIVASGELVIINDRYGVKINEIFTEEKDQASQNAEFSETDNNYEDEEVDEDEQMAGEMFEEEHQQAQENPPQEPEDSNEEEDFDYSDFDVDEEDI